MGGNGVRVGELGEEIALCVLRHLYPQCVFRHVGRTRKRVGDVICENEECQGEWEVKTSTCGIERATTRLRHPRYKKVRHIAVALEDTGIVVVIDTPGGELERIDEVTLWIDGVQYPALICYSPCPNYQKTSAL